MSDHRIKKTIYFIRHGQSDDNIAPVFQSPDSPLSDTGRAQAELIAQRVAKLSFETLIASPFDRTKQTAEAITRVTGMNPEYSELFVEAVKPTSVNGKRYDDEHADKVWRKWMESMYTPGMRVEDGENYDDIVARADNALHFLESREEQSLVVVSHGYFLRTIIGRVLLGDAVSGGALQSIQTNASMENTGITVIRLEERSGVLSWRLWTYNDHAHLG